jgi:hypothetical protein
MATLLYANPELRVPQRRRWLGAIAGAVAVVAAFLITYNSLALAESLTA